MKAGALKNCLLISLSSAQKQSKLQMNQMFNSAAGTGVTRSTQSPTERDRQSEFAEQDSDTGRTAKQASKAEMRGLQTVTLTGF